MAGYAFTITASEFANRTDAQGALDAALDAIAETPSAAEAAAVGTVTLSEGNTMHPALSAMVHRFQDDRTLDNATYRVMFETAKEALGEAANADAETASNPPVIFVDLFGIQVAVYTSDAERIETLAAQGITANKGDPNAFATAHVDRDDSGRAWFSMVIPHNATQATRAHECVHIADWIMHEIGIPTHAENTEVRGYLVGHLMVELQEILGQPRGVKA